MMYSNIKHKITSKEIEINITTDNKSEQVWFGNQVNHKICLGWNLWIKRDNRLQTVLFESTQL